MESRITSPAWTPATPAVSSRIAFHRDQEGRDTKTSLRILYLSLFALLTAFLPTSAHAYPGGIAGYSGKGGTTCTACHSSGTASAVTMALPATVTSGSTYTLTLNEVAGSGSGGLDVAGSAGTFTAGTGTKVLSGELVQSGGSSTHSWTFSWTAPTVTASTAATLYGAAMDSYGGNTGTVVATTTVMPAVATKPAMTLAPTSLSFSYQIGGSNPAAQTVAVGSSTSTAFSYTATTATAWLTTTASGTTPGSLSIGVNPTGLAAGTYTGAVAVASTGASNSPQSVPVTLTVTSNTTLPNLNLSPTSVTFNYQIGGSNPAAQNVATSSSTATAITYTATSSAAWLSTTASGTTPGTLALSVNPTGLAAGTYTGTISIASSGEAKSPVTLPVTLNVTSGTTTPTLNLTPSSLSFSFATGGTAPAAKTLSIASSTSAVLSYTAAASGGSWLTLASTSGNTPGSISVSVNPASMAAGTYTGTITVTSSGASNSPQSIPVTLTVTSGTGTGHLVVKPRWISFNYATGQSAPAPKSVDVTSTGTALSYTAAAFGGSWLSVTPSGGTTTGKVSITANPDGLPTGTYAGVVQISAPGSPAIDLPVSLNVGTKSGGGEGDDGAIQAMPITSDVTQSGSVNAKWINGAGVPNANDSKDPQNQGLLITKSSNSATKASAGVVINNADGMALTALGFDIRNGSQCTARTPAFVVVTSDGVNHTVGGCTKGTKQSSPAQGWTRMRFDPSNPAQATPPIAPGATVKTIQLVVNEGPEAGSGMVIVDNILVNKTVIGKQ